MNQVETIEQFYIRKHMREGTLDVMSVSDIGQVNVFQRENCALVTSYNRRDFYKVSLVIGTGTLHYADKWLYIDRPALLFSNPMVPYSWEADSDEQSGWFCLFTEKYMLEDGFIGNLQQNPFFKIGGDPVFFLSEVQTEEIAALFQKMKQELVSEYPHKYAVVRNYLQLLIHEALKIKPVENYVQHKNASQRIVSLFIELLERQFPIDTPSNDLKLNTAADFAKHLNIHVNSLNRALKQETGKTTSDLIGERIIQEAKALLRHSDWNVSEVAYALGFDEPAYFINFFKKKTDTTPNAYRNALV